MEVQVKPGKYVVAVSGGVDSMVLLHLLLKVPQVELVVAHYDHGMRHESASDRQFVEGYCTKKGLVFEYEQGNLGPRASEATAREYRYDFLKRIKEKHNADSVATAHHQDDLIETMFINLFRGTNRRGLASLKSTPYFVRPLLNYSKQDITQYAHDNKIDWVEDQTNTDKRYLRNQIRLEIIPKMDKNQRKQIVEMQLSLANLNREIDQEIATLLSGYSGAVERTWFIQFPYVIQCELVAEILRQENQEITREKITKTVLGIKTLLPGKRLEIGSDFALLSSSRQVKFVRAST